MTERPRATYRLQLTPAFKLTDAALAVPYLSALGITHIYLSPVLEAVAGSDHGYDVVDHSKVREELGADEAFLALSRAASEADMGLLLDIVPNHMAIGGEENRWWWDVLEDGRNSQYARFFDVDWDESAEVNLITLPVLEDRYGRVLEKRLVRIVRLGENLRVEYRDHSFPLSPHSVAGVFERTGDPRFLELSRQLRTLVRGPSKRRMSKRSRIRTSVAALIKDEKAVGLLDGVVEELNSDNEQLHLVLEAQNYRLAYWRKGIRELGYRRFFDISTLAALRVEDDLVFQETHRLVISWLQSGMVDGLRVDHIDGLRDPKSYLGRLIEAGAGWLVVEKILAPHESLPDDWPVAGTTGYDFLNVVNRLWVDERAAAEFDQLYSEIAGEEETFEKVAYESKVAVMRGTLAPDIMRLSSMLAEIAERDLRHRDFLRSELHDALIEVIAFCPVYRTYAEPGDPLSPGDLETIHRSIELARKNRPDLDPELFDLISVKWKGQQGAEDFTYRLQQTTGPVAAKGVEDTAMYRHVRLTSLNEVGAEPTEFGISETEFHDRMTKLSLHPLGLLSTSTHDTKRSEDVRSRISVLTEIPGEWSSSVRRWFDANSKHKLEGLPDRATEYLLYQTLVGAYPIGEERATAYMLKAAREAKLHTSWTNQDRAYEEALTGFVRNVLADRTFCNELEAVVARVEAPGISNSLGQLVIKLTAPGVPDIYQGCELLDLSLVDPDNRRPVDYERRFRLLDEVGRLTPGQAWERRAEGLAKLFVTRTGLQLRLEKPEVFGPPSSYFPIPTSERGVVAFGRGVGTPQVVAVIPRFTVDGPVEHSFRLPDGVWRDLLGPGTFEGTASTAELFDSMPLSILVAS